MGRLNTTFVRVEVTKSVQHLEGCRKRLYVRFVLVLTKVAAARYNDILSASDASEIEYEAVDAQDVKPTKGAMRIVDLLETFTGLSL